MIRPLRRLQGLLVAAVIACAAPEVDEGPVTGEIIEDGPCATDVVSCLESLDMLQCIEGRWTPSTCDEYCAMLGPGVTSQGSCTEEGLSLPVLACSCTPPPEGCEPGQARCDDSDTLVWCTDQWTWSNDSCIELCAAQSYESIGCVSSGDKAICMCTNVGTPCTDEPALCADDSRLISCEAGVWTEVDCSEICGGPGQCDPSMLPQADCVCG